MLTALISSAGIQNTPAKGDILTFEIALRTTSTLDGAGLASLRGVQLEWTRDNTAPVTIP